MYNMSEPVWKLKETDSGSSGAASGRDFTWLVAVKLVML